MKASAKENLFAQRMASVAGLGTWLVIGLPIIVSGLQAETNGLFEGKLLGWLSCYLLFGGFFLFDSFHSLGKLKKHYPFLPLIFLSTLVTIMMFLLPYYQLLAILFIITAVEAAYNLPMKFGLIWILGQSLIVFSALITGQSTELFFTLVLSFAYFGFQAFALLSTYATLNEAKAKTELAQVNAELRATQSLLTESSRMSERLRISRDLHDLIGHHLTALSLNLEVASHLSEGQAKETVDQARAIAKLLLSDVRDVVSTMRDNDAIDLNKALSSLLEGIPQPKVHLKSTEDLSLDNPERAQVVLRCVQEMITNSIKHAEADNIYLSLEKTETGIQIHAKDDGKGSKDIQPGNGLTGMQERLEHIGGKLELRSQPGQGFSLNAYVPA